MVVCLLALISVGMIVTKHYQSTEETQTGPSAIESFVYQTMEEVHNSCPTIVAAVDAEIEAQDGSGSHINNYDSIVAAFVKAYDEETAECHEVFASISTKSLEEFGQELTPQEVIEKWIPVIRGDSSNLSPEQEFVEATMAVVYQNCHVISEGIDSGMETDKVDDMPRLFLEAYETETDECKEALKNETSAIAEQLGIEGDFSNVEDLANFWVATFKEHAN